MMMEMMVAVVVPRTAIRTLSERNAFLAHGIGGERLTYNRLLGNRSLQIQKRDRSILTVVLLSMSGA